ncbi:MAG TPA: FtsX-like permease family protein [Acidobacteriota bacterium]|jgi:putative ABC transport system permease protein
MALWLISIQQFRIHWLKNLLTTFGIILGVAVFFAMRTANQSLQEEFRKTIDKIAGKAQLQVVGGDVGMPEPFLEQVQSTEGVEFAVPVVEAVVQTQIRGEGNLLILGVDFTGDNRLRDYHIEDESQTEIEDPLVFLAQPDSICLTRDFAQRNSLKLGSTIELDAALGRKRFVVRGLISPGHLASAFGGNIAVMDIYAAQFMLNRGQKFDRIDIALSPGQEIEDVRRRLQKKLPAGFKIQTPDQRGKQIENLTSAFTLGLFISSLIAMLVGVFLIFNSFAVAVTRRRKDIGILRALGATRRQVQNLFLVEALLLGVVGSAAGALLGWAGAWAVISFMDRVIQGSYNVSVHTTSIRTEPLFIGAALMLGICASLLGAFIPARAAATVDPALALQKGKHQTLLAGESRWRRIFAVAILLLALLLTLFPLHHSRIAEYVQFALVFIGLALLVPSMAHWLSLALRAPLSRLFGVEGTLACDSLIQAPRRTSSTVAALLFSLAFVVSNSTFTASIKQSMLNWMTQTVNAQMFVTSSENLASRVVHFPASMKSALAGIPGVRQVDSVRLINHDYRGNPILIFSIEMPQFFRRARFILKEGDKEIIPRALADQNTVIVSENFSILYKVHLGDALELDTPSGTASLRVVGVMEDYSSDKGSLAMDRQNYIRLWKDDTVDTFDLMLAPGARPEEVKREILSRFVGQERLFVFTNDEFRRKILALIDQFFALTSVQIIVAISVAVLGIINTLFISISDRRRDIGILKVIGGLQYQIRKLILLEACCIALIATVLGTMAGAYLGYFSNRTLALTFSGWWIPYYFDWRTALLLFPTMMLVGVLAAWYPAQTAIRLPLIDALGYE